MATKLRKDGKFVTSSQLIQRKSTIVDASISTKQNLLDSVPEGKKRIIEKIVLRDTIGDLSNLTQGLYFGWSSTIVNPEVAQLGPESAQNNDQSYSVWTIGAAETSNYGVEGNVFGMRFLDYSQTGTLSIDVIFFDMDI